MHPLSQTVISGFFLGFAQRRAGLLQRRGCLLTGEGVKGRQLAGATHICRREDGGSGRARGRGEERQNSDFADCNEDRKNDITIE